MPQVITFASTGTPFNFRVNAMNSTGGNWLSITNTGGHSYSTPTDVTISVNPGTTLATGTYAAEIIALSTDGTQSQIIPVTLNVEAPLATFFDELPGQLTFSMLTKGSAPPQQMVQITNSGGYSYPTPTTVTLSVNPDVNLAPGVYTASVYGTDTAGAEPLVIPVTLIINSASATASPTFTPPGGSYSTAQTVSLASTTIDAAIHYTVDGTSPTTASARYTTPVPVTATETIKAIAIAPGIPQSAIASATYTTTSPRAATRPSHKRSPSRRPQQM